jgi:competence protein ComEA
VHLSGGELLSEVKSSKYRLAVIVFLSVVIAAGVLFIWARYEPGEAVVIYRTPSEIYEGKIYIGGTVNLPGYYPYRYGDTLDSLLRSAGGVTGNTAPGELTLSVSNTHNEQQAQKVNINRAEVWLLQALPGIGEILAQKIVDYRELNGPFINILQLKDVEGIGEVAFSKIENYVTVSD